MTHTLYTKDFGKLTVEVLENDINDLSLWSVHNGDKYNEFIGILKTAIEAIKKDMEKA